MTPRKPMRVPPGARVYVRQEPEPTGGWRAALRDTLVGICLAAVVVALAAVAIAIHPESLVTPLPWPSAAP
jgi:hypothetical protein